MRRGREGSAHCSGGGRDQRHGERELAEAHEKAGQRKDELRGNGGKEILHGDEKGTPKISEDTMLIAYAVMPTTYPRGSLK